MKLIVFISNMAINSLSIIRCVSQCVLEALSLLFQPYIKFALGIAIWSIINVITSLTLSFIILYKRYKFTFISSLLTLSVFFLGGCGESNREKEISERIEKNRKEKHNYISNIVNKFEIKYCWDTVHHNHSIDYQYILNTKYQLINDFSISDIYTKNETNYASIEVGLFEKIYFELECTQEQVNILREKKSYSKDFQNETLLIVSISQIRKISYPVTIEYYDEDYDSSVESEVEEGFKARGKLFDIVKF